MEESRDVLVLASYGIFANLTRLHLSIDLEAVTAPVDLNVRTPAMQKAAEAYASKFDLVEVGEDEDDSEEDAEEEEEGAVDGEGASGGP